VARSLPEVEGTLVSDPAEKFESRERFFHAGSAARREEVLVMNERTLGRCIASHRVV
jgi:hypothetical protein